MQKKIKILGIPFDNVTLEEALKEVEKMMSSEDQFHIATPNPEMLLEAQKNEKFRLVLQNTALNIPDGVGIILASIWLRKPLKQRVTGIDLMEKIIEKSKGKKIFLLGAAKGVAEKTAEIFQKKFPEVKIAGTHSGSPKVEDEKKIVNKINSSAAEILFVAYGAPAQELWIERNLKKMPTVKIAIGIGGAFDFITGIQKRAPKWMQKIGLEWLYRLLQEPKRTKRIINATIRFPIIFLRRD